MKPLQIFAVLLLLIGAYLLVGGVWLLVLGGSPYYAAAGAAVLASGGLLWRQIPWGATVLELTVALTVPWAVWEAGFDPWALAPRTLPPLILVAILFSPWIRRSLHPDEAHDGASSGWKGAAAIAGIAVLAAAAMAGPELRAREQGAPASAFTSEEGDWRNYGNSLAGSRFSPLDQIGENNVRELERAWQYRSGDLPRRSDMPDAFSFEVTPIEVDDTLYFCTPHALVIALNAETGEERWRFDPEAQTADASRLICRGVSYYSRAGANGACAARIVGATADARLFALDAQSGAPCAGFGDNGFVSLLTGMGETAPGAYLVPSPPTIAGNRILVGGWTDNQLAAAPSGVIRAFNAVSGTLLWAWDMGAPRRTGAPGAGQIYTPRTPSAPAPFAADPQLGLVYVATGSPPLAVGEDERRAFDARYADSVVALDLNNGRPRWSFQTTHRDIWDYGLAAQPVLIELPIIGGVRPALIQATRRGEVFVLDRRNGRAIVEFAEQAVPQGATLSPTQPFSQYSLLPPPLTETDMWGITPLDHLVCRIRFRRARYDGPFTPLGTAPTITYPGAMGTVGWGSIAVDEVNKLVFANTNRIASYDRLVAQDDGTFLRTSRPFLGPFGAPCNEPPWGHLQLFDLKTNRHAWNRPIGSARDIGLFGLPSFLPFTIGTPNLGGSLVTRGALVFNSAPADRYLRAYNVFTGEALWRARLPAGGQATPMTYMTSSGRQFVAVAAGGDQRLGTRTGDYIIAYALPQN